MSEAFGKLKYPEHVPDHREECFKDIFNYMEALGKVANKDDVGQFRVAVVQHRDQMFIDRESLLRGTDAERIEAERKAEQVRSNRWEMALIAKKKKDQVVAQALQNRKSLPPFKGTRSSSFMMNPEGSSATSLRIEEDGPIIPPSFSAKPVS